jgi:hypothetical protein
VAHGNLGITLTPRERATSGERATTREWTTSGSIVWLTRSSFNVLVEAVYQGTEDVVAARETSRGSVMTISPGIRWAHNFSSGLQIVPGIACPLGVGPSSGERSIFLYLSFEHPFTKEARARAASR